MADHGERAEHGRNQRDLLDRALQRVLVGERGADRHRAGRGGKAPVHRAPGQQRRRQRPDRRHRADEALPCDGRRDAEDPADDAEQRLRPERIAGAQIGAHDGVRGARHGRGRRCAMRLQMGDEQQLVGRVVLDVVAADHPVAADDHTGVEADVDGQRGEQGPAGVQPRPQPPALHERAGEREPRHDGDRQPVAGVRAVHAERDDHARAEAERDQQRVRQLHAGGALDQQALPEGQRPHHQRHASDRRYVIPRTGRRHCLAPAQPEDRKQEGAEEDLDADDQHRRRDHGEAFVGQ